MLPFAFGVDGGGWAELQVPWGRDMAQEAALGQSARCLMGRKGHLANGTDLLLLGKDEGDETGQCMVGLVDGRYTPGHTAPRSSKPHHGSILSSYPLRSKVGPHPSTRGGGV